MRIKILGSGCARCNRLEQLAREAVAELGIDAEFEHVRDMEAIMAYPIMTTPALVVDGELKIQGRIATVEEIAALLK